MPKLYLPLIMLSSMWHISVTKVLWYSSALIDSLMKRFILFGALDIFRGTMVSENINLYTVITALAFTKGKGKRKAFAHTYIKRTCLILIGNCPTVMLSFSDTRKTFFIFISFVPSAINRFHLIYVSAVSICFYCHWTVAGKYGFVCRRVAGNGGWTTPLCHFCQLSFATFVTFMP